MMQVRELIEAINPGTQAVVSDVSDSLLARKL
jgi:hypothetical protein